MSKWSETIIAPSSVNEGNEFNPGDGVRANDINKVFNSVFAMQNALKNLENSASPKEVFATLDKLKEKYPNGTNGIMLVTADGHWYYYYNNAWTDGGVYQATDAGKLRSDIQELKENTEGKDPVIKLNEYISIRVGSYIQTYNLNSPIKAGNEIIVSLSNFPITPGYHQFSLKDKNGNNLNRVFVNDVGTHERKFVMDEDVYAIGFSFNNATGSIIDANLKIKLQSLFNNVSYLSKKVEENTKIVNQIKEDFIIELNKDITFNNPSGNSYPTYNLNSPIKSGEKIIVSLSNFPYYTDIRHSQFSLKNEGGQNLNKILIEKANKDFEFIMDEDVYAIGFSIGKVDTVINSNLKIKTYTLKNNVKLAIEDINNLKNEFDVFKNNIPVIIDTDFSGDVDDAVALRVASWAEHEGIIQIKGCVTNNYTRLVAPAVDSFLNNYGCKNVEIGWDVEKRCSWGNIVNSYQSNMVRNGTSKYATTDEYPSALKIYRRILARSSKKVRIVSLGFCVNLQGLLESKADEYSSLTGLELVKQKVETIYVMGGRYPSGWEYNFSYDTETIKSAKYLLENSPVKLILFGVTVGLVKVGQNLKDIYSSGSEDMLYQAYIDYGKSTGKDVINEGHEAFDPMTMYIAIVGDPQKCGYNVTQGTYILDENGNGNFITSDNGLHYSVSRNKPDAYYQEQINSKLF